MTDEERLADLVRGMHHPDKNVRIRAADAAEKMTRGQPGLLAPFQRELLGLLPLADPAALRWHLAQMLPRLTLTPRQRQRAVEWLRQCLQDRSSIVKTCAMETLAQMLSPHDAVEMIRAQMETGTPAVKARGRKLLKAYAHMRLPPP